MYYLAFCQLVGVLGGLGADELPSMRVPSFGWQTVEEIGPTQPDRQSLRCSDGPGEGAYRIPDGIFMFG